MHDEFMVYMRTLVEASAPTGREARG
jgi:hypothetical protein